MRNMFKVNDKDTRMTPWTYVVVDWTLTNFSKIIRDTQALETAARRFSHKEKLFWKYAANLQDNTHTKVWFQWSCCATLLKSHFAIGVLLQIWKIFSEHLLRATPGGCFWSARSWSARLLLDDWYCIGNVLCKAKT